MGMTTLLSSKLNSDRGSCSRTLVSRTKFFFIDGPGCSLRDLECEAMGLRFLAVVPTSIGMDPTPLARSILPEQLLNRPGHRERGHPFPGEALPEAGEIEPVLAPCRLSEWRPAFRGVQGPGQARVKGGDHQIRGPRHPFATGPHTPQLQSPGEEPERAEPRLVPQGLEPGLGGAVHEDEVTGVGPGGVEG